MQLPTNYKMGTGLAATIMGQQAGLEQEKMGLENLYRGMEMPGQILKGQEQAMLLNDPNYLQQKTANTLIELSNQHDAGQFQQALNTFGRFKIQLQSAAGDPQKTQQIVMNGLQQMNIDPNSDFGRFAMQNPEKAIDQLIQGTEASLARTGGAKQAGAKELTMLKESGDTERARLLRENQLEIARIHEGGANARAANQNKYEFNTNKILMDAANGDVKAQQVVNLMSQMKGAAQSGGLAIDPNTNSLTTKGAMMQVPYPDAGLPQQQGGKPTGGSGSYNYVPGQGLQPSGNTSTQRTPPISGRNAVSDNAPYISKSGGVVANGRTYTYDEYMKSPLSKQYDYADLQVK